MFRHDLGLYQLFGPRRPQNRHRFQAEGLPSLNGLDRSIGPAKIISAFRVDGAGFPVSAVFRLIRQSGAGFPPLGLLSENRRMETLLIGVRATIIRLVIFLTHGKRLARNVVRLDPDTTGSGTRMIGERKYWSTSRRIVFGRRFTNLLGRSRC
jgi:hypothetical protein